jgi:hypothetical protein
MSKTVCVKTTATEKPENVRVLFVKVSESLEADLTEAARKAGVSKAGLVRMALPLGIVRLFETLNKAEA